MYKKMLAALIGFQSFVCAEGLSGFSVGGFLGTEARVTQNKYKDSYYSYFSNDHSRYKVGHLFGLFGRYGRVINHNLYLGGVLYSFGTTKNNKLNLNDDGLNFNYKRGMVTGITPVVGHVFSADSMAYAKFGFEVSKDKASYSAVEKQPSGRNYIQYAEASKTVYAFAPGFGFEHKFNNHFVAGVEYSYSIGQKIDVSKDFSVKRRSHQVMFRFAYKI